MVSTAKWHASPSRTAAASHDRATGEVRIRLALYELDEHRGDVSLVLSRVEADALRTALDDMLPGAATGGAR